MKILVAAGGTGGHIYPALALIEKFKSKDKKTQVIYVGTKNRMEKDIVPKLGIEYRAIEIYGLTKNVLNDVKNVYLILKDINEMKQLIKEFKPDVVLGIGGYVTYPVIVAAHQLHVPIFIHEQNAIPGKVNRLTEKYADLIGLSVEESKKYFKNKNTFYSGNPTGSRALTIPKVKKRDIGFDEKKKLIVVVAGSLGSSTLSEKLKEYLKLVKNKDYQVLYITGRGIYENFANETYSKNVKIVPFFDNLPGILKSADLVVSRAGASTIAEITTLKVPAIFIPSPYVANNHQYYNAKAMKDKNCAEMLSEENLDVINLSNTIDMMLDNKDVYIDNLKKMDVVDSGELIYNKIKEMLESAK